MKPTMFIGSSTKFAHLADALKKGLKDNIEAEVWRDGILGVAATTLDSLVEQTRKVDLAAFIFGDDDELRGAIKNLHVTRDNVIFELGLFIGASSRSRCFFVTPAGHAQFHVPSDLAGVTYTTFDPDLINTNPDTCVSIACSSISRAVTKLQGEYRLSGNWTHNWQNPKGEKESCSLDLIQLGTHVRGVYHWNNSRYELRGRIEGNRFLSAQYSCVDKPHDYSGMLHLVLSPQGELTGKWIGWSHHNGENGVNSGSCKWTRS